MAREGKITKEILKKLLIGGTIIFAAQSPYFWFKVYKKIFSSGKIPKKKVVDIFCYLRRRGLIDVQKRKNQIYISLTKKGESEAGRFQINKLKIIPQEKWDKKWRLIIFDIPEKSRIKREAFRGKIKELGFYPLQKSVWIYPYPCQKEISLLRDFFGLKTAQLMLLTVEEIEDDQFLYKFFKLS